MKSVIGMLSFFLFLHSSVSIAEESNGGLLTGDVKLACETILCLSSGGGRPSECNEALERYFSINKKKLKDTLNARRDFLKLCPASNEEGMPTLTDAIVEGAGKCDAMVLNSQLVETKEYYSCKNTGSHNDRTCTSYNKYRISNKMPSYCKKYISHEYTDFNLHYDGSPQWQLDKDFKANPTGRWVD